MKISEKLICAKTALKTILSGIIAKNSFDNFIFFRYSYLLLLFKKIFLYFCSFFPFELVRFPFIRNHIFTVFYFYRIILSIKEMMGCI